jgi:hypothetical protein
MVSTQISHGNEACSTAVVEQENFGIPNETNDNPNGIVAGLVRGLTTFPRALAMAKRAIAQKIVGQFPNKLAVKKVGKFSDLTSFFLDLWSNYRDASNGQASRQGTLQLLKVTGMSMARSTVMGTTAFMSFEKTNEAGMKWHAPSTDPAVGNKPHVPFAPGTWMLSSFVAGSGHTAVGVAWDVLVAREVVSAAAIRVAWASSLASHTSLFTTYFSTKSLLLSRLDCDPASPSGVLCISAAGAAAGSVAHIAETLVPDELPQKPGRGVWAELLRRSRLLSAAAALRAAPATVVAFLAYEFAETG